MFVRDQQREAVSDTIAKLKDPVYQFTAADITSLSTFVSGIDKIANAANFINNFKQGTVLDSGTLDLPTLFNEMKTTATLSKVNYPLSDRLKSHFPNLYAIVKHCQLPEDYPVNYKFWRNMLREVFRQDTGYDNLKEFYRKLPAGDRHLNFGAYLGAIGIGIAQKIREEHLNKSASGNRCTQKHGTKYRYSKSLPSHQWICFGS